MSVHIPGGSTASSSSGASDRVSDLPIRGAATRISASLCVGEGQEMRVGERRAHGFLDLITRGRRLGGSAASCGKAKSALNLVASARRRRVSRRNPSCQRGRRRPEACQIASVLGEWRRRPRASSLASGCKTLALLSGNRSLLPKVYTVW